MSWREVISGKNGDLYGEKRTEAYAVESTCWFKGRNALKNSKAQLYNGVI